MTQISFAEYIWLDGSFPSRQIRSKMRFVRLDSTPKISDFPEWSFDGSSTNQATGDNSDCILKPVSFIKDPIRKEKNYLVMCEVFTGAGEVHVSNSRAHLRKVLSAGADKHDPWIGFEQEYTLFHQNEVVGWPRHGLPHPQGPYYCGVGADKIAGRHLVEMHAKACQEADIMFYGVNAEVMLGQWEFQIGYRGYKDEPKDVLTISDHLWYSRWLLERLGEDLNIIVSLDPKPVKGDWNGAGMHTNFSTTSTRDEKHGLENINNCIKLLSTKHSEHVEVYGYNLSDRLTGLHETCDIDTFKGGVADRGASIRIPQNVNTAGYGYLEDRRPGANADPYLVAARLCGTICEIDEEIVKFHHWHV
jgi:glutamine synthetase